MTENEPNATARSTEKLVPAAQIIEHRVRPGAGTGFAAVVKSMIEAASRFPGYQGVDVAQPGGTEEGGAGEGWRIVVRFASEDQLRSWRGSPIARRWQERADALTIGAPRLERANGLETWFTLPARGSSPPPKWKTAIISAIGIYPLLLTVPPLLGSVTGSLPEWAGTIVSVIVMSPLITWVVMPAVTRIFRPFLYPSLESESR